MAPARRPEPWLPPQGQFLSPPKWPRGAHRAPEHLTLCIRALALSSWRRHGDRAGFAVAAAAAPGAYLSQFLPCVSPLRVPSSCVCAAGQHCFVQVGLRRLGLPVGAGLLGRRQYLRVTWTSTPLVSSQAEHLSVWPSFVMSSPGPYHLCGFHCCYKWCLVSGFLSSLGLAWEMLLIFLCSVCIYFPC